VDNYKFTKHNFNYAAQHMLFSKPMRFGSNALPPPSLSLSLFLSLKNGVEGEVLVQDQLGTCVTYQEKENKHAVLKNRDTEF
jgi:hypothetical protein